MVRISVVQYIQIKYILCSHLHAVVQPDDECGQWLVECTAT